ncbi:MAG: DUF427 domain-containing protein [Chloroflexi bacterium]|nr:DUF427 domain-containing protein [Chloroflexota bacterium]
MAKAIWNGTVLAESDKTETVEGNHYFPLSSINREYFKESRHTSICPWKGVANYYTIEVGEQKNENAAWYYPSPKNAASNIRNHVAFWRGVKIKA